MTQCLTWLYYNSAPRTVSSVSFAFHFCRVTLDYIKELSLSPLYVFFTAVGKAVSFFHCKIQGKFAFSNHYFYLELNYNGKFHLKDCTFITQNVKLFRPRMDKIQRQAKSNEFSSSLSIQFCVIIHFFTVENQLILLSKII